MTKRERLRAARMITTAMRVAGDGQGKGNKGMAMATRITGERTATATKRMMLTAMRVAGKQR
jgi:hypothetical protein